MSTRDSNRKFQPGPGWLLFFGMVGLLLFNKNSRQVLQTLRERTRVQVERINTNYQGMKSTLEKKKLEESGK